jgi:hypothetical protein
MNSAKLIDLVAVDFLDLFPCQKNRLLFQIIQPGNRFCGR